MRKLGIIFLFLVEVALFIVNYKLGTFLIGWDSLHPELNFPVHFERGLFSIWQEYRGLGLLDGMAQAATLPHTLILWLLHFFLPISFLRYFLVFGMHFLGGAGVYFLLKNLVVNDDQDREIVAIFGSLLYLFGLATIQMFYAPFEVFVFHFAFLPWLALSLVWFIESGKRSKLFLFCFFSLLSLPQAHVPTVFLAYALLVGTILLEALVEKKTAACKRSIIILGIIFCFNAFWGLPFVYQTLANAGTVIDSKINQMSNQEIYLRNRERGNLIDVLVMKGAMLDMVEPNGANSSDFIMREWRYWVEKPTFKIVSFAMTFLMVLGFVRAFRKKELFAFRILILIAFFFLALNVPIISSLNFFLREKMPLFREVFRFPFTKFSILFVFCYAIFFAFGLRTLLAFCRRLIKGQIVVWAFFCLVVASIFYYAFPAFQGGFLFNSLKLIKPTEYFQASIFFQKADLNTRIAIFPLPNFWSWRFLINGYRGSGFLWQGIKQPILDRAFDPWSRQNENYYWEMSNAFYSGNRQLLEKVLEKYQINWLLVDENVFNPSSTKSVYFDKLEAMLGESPKISLARVFGKIKIYKVNLETPVKDFVYLAKDLPVVGPEYSWNNNDQALTDSGHYLTSDKATVYYPFRSLFTGKTQEEIEFAVEEQPDRFIFKKKIPDQFKNYSLEVPEGRNELLWINPDNLQEQQAFLPEIGRSGQELRVTVPKVGGYYSAKITPDRNDGSWPLPNLPHQQSYLITVKSRNLEGKSLLFWLENLNIRKADIETYLPQSSQWQTSYFIQPPMEEDGLGYTLHFDKLEVGNFKTVNELGEMTVNPLPYRFLTELKLVSPDRQSKAVLTSPLKVDHPNPSYYKITMPPTEQSTLVLSQSFEKGWLAFQGNLLGQRIKNHFLVDNWANGWQVPAKTQTVVLLYWPQFLEYFGFALLFGGFAVILTPCLQHKLRKLKKKTS